MGTQQTASATTSVSQSKSRMVKRRRMRITSCAATAVACWKIIIAAMSLMSEIPAPQWPANYRERAARRKIPAADCLATARDVLSC